MRSMASSATSPSRPEPGSNLRLVMDSCPALIHTALPDGYIDFFNEAWLKYVGLPLEDLRGWAWTVAIHPEDVEGILEKWRASLASGEHFLHEARVRRADGEYRWMQHHKVPLHDEHGNIVKWYGSSIDIEDRKQADEALRASEEQWRNVFENNPTMYFMVDAAGMVKAVNPFGADQLGYSVRELVGQPVLNVFYGPDREAVQKNFAQCLKQLGQSFSWELRKVRKDGSMLWVRETARAVPGSNGPLVLIGCEDITDRKNAEERIREQEIELRQVLDLAPQHIAVLGPDGSRLYVNQRTLDYYGLTLEEWQTCGPHKLVHPEDWDRFDREVQDATLDRVPARGRSALIEKRREVSLVSFTLQRAAR